MSASRRAENENREEMKMEMEMQVDDVRGNKTKRRRIDTVRDLIGVGFELETKAATLASMTYKGTDRNKAKGAHRLEETAEKENREPGFLEHGTAQADGDAYAIAEPLTCSRHWLGAVRCYSAALSHASSDGQSDSQEKASQNTITNGSSVLPPVEEASLLVRLALLLISFTRNVKEAVGLTRRAVVLLEGQQKKGLMRDVITTHGVYVETTLKVHIERTSDGMK